MSPRLLAALALAVAAGVLMDRFALRFLRPPRRAITLDPTALGLHAEEVILPGEVDLHLWVVESEASDPESVVLLVHGWGANASGPLQLMPALVEAGHTVAAVDVRGHGRSEAGPFVTLRHFRDDVRRTVQHLRERFPSAELTVVGHSMGGAAGVLVAADGGGIDRLVTVAAPYDVYDATRRYLARKKMPAGPLLGAFRLLWRRRIGVPYDHIHPGERAREIRIPTLVLQPERDVQVPLDQGRLLADSLGVEPEIVEDAGHSDVLARPEVHRRIARFIGEQRPIDPIA